MSLLVGLRCAVSRSLPPARRCQGFCADVGALCVVIVCVDRRNKACSVFSVWPECHNTSKPLTRLLRLLAGSAGHWRGESARYVSGRSCMMEGALRSRAARSRMRCWNASVSFPMLVAVWTVSPEPTSENSEQRPPLIGCPRSSLTRSPADSASFDRSLRNGLRGQSCEVGYPTVRNAEAVGIDVVLDDVAGHRAISVKCPFWYHTHAGNYGTRGTAWQRRRVRQRLRMPSAVTLRPRHLVATHVLDSPRRGSETEQRPARPIREARRVRLDPGDPVGEDRLRLRVIRLDGGTG